MGPSNFPSISSYLVICLNLASNFVNFVSATDLNINQAREKGLKVKTSIREKNPTGGMTKHASNIMSDFRLLDTGNSYQTDMLDPQMPFYI